MAGYPTISRVQEHEGTGTYRGWDGQGWVPLSDLRRHEETGDIWGTTEGGQTYLYKPPTPDEDSWSVDLYNPTSRAFGILFGLGNAPLAFGLGGLAAPKTHPEEYKKAPFKTAFREAFSSAWRSASQEGDWGVTYSDYFRQHTGRSIKQSLEEVLNVEESQGAQKHNIYALKKLVAEMGEPTLELLVGMAMDPAVSIASYGAYLRKMAKGGRVGADTAKELQRLAQDRRNTGLLMEKIKSSDEIVHAHQTTREALHEQAAVGMKELERMQAKREMAYLEAKMAGKSGTKFGDPLIRTAKGRLQRTPSGRRLFELLERAKDAGEIQWATDLEDVVKFADESGAAHDDIRMVLDGFGSKVRDRRAHTAAERIRPTLDKVYKRAQDAGIDVAPFIDNYFPHRFSDELVERLGKPGKFRRDMLRQVVKEGKFSSTASAAEKLDGFIARWKGNHSDFRFIDWMAKQMGVDRAKALEIWEQFIKHGHVPVDRGLKMPRKFRVPWYERNLHVVMTEYLSNANRGIENARHLGPKAERVMGAKGAPGLIDGIMKEGGQPSAEYAKLFVDTYLYPPRAIDESQKIAKLLGFQTVTKLNPLTTLVNLSQTMAIPLRTSLKATMKGIAGYDKEFARRSSATIAQTIRDIMRVHGAGGPISSNYLRAIGFTKTEEILRTLASNAGAQHALDMAELIRKGKRTKYARRQLRSMKINPVLVANRGGRVTEKELLKAGKRISRETQFRGDIFDLPTWWTSPYGRLITQFKTFVFNQARLVKNHVFAELKAGNVRPLAWLATAYPVVGTGYDVLIDQVILGKEPPESIPEWWWRGISAVGGLGIFMTTLESAQYGAGAVAKAFTGPTIGDATELLSMAATVNEDTSIDRMVQFLAGHTPAAGRVLRSALKEEGGTRSQR